MSKHTPGPWDVATIDCGESDDEIVTEVNGVCVNIAAMFGPMKYSEARPDGSEEPHYEVSEDEAKANARLIAAAPNLLAALERLVGFTEAFHGDAAREIHSVEFARAAIAEATCQEVGQ